MRRANGDGSIFKLSGKRRRPYAVRVTVGWTDDGKQKYKYIGYYKNKTDAKNALNKYLVDPSDVIANNVTLKYVFDNMINKSNFSDGTIKQYKSTFNALQLLHNKNISSITLNDIENVLHGKKPVKQTAIKKVLNNCYTYAMKYDYVKKNLAQFITVQQHTEKRAKTPFTASEINKLWETLGTKQNDDIALILLYTGLRIGELLELKNENVNLQEKYIDVIKSKTAAGVRRVPLHNKILPLIAARFEPGNKYLIVNTNGGKMTYINYLLTYWDNKAHTIHETRHTFVTWLNSAGVDDLTIKRIVGHANKDITQHYTHITHNELLDAVNKLEYK